MNGKISFWTVRTSAGWGVKRQGDPRILAVYDWQEQAWKEARRLTGGKQEVSSARPVSRTVPVRSAPSYGTSSRGAQSNSMGAGPVRRGSAVAIRHAAA